MGVKKSGFDELDADLRHAIEEALPEARKIVGKGCLEIKKTAQKIIRENSHRGYLPHYPRAISYDTKIEGTVASGEVGPLIGRLQAGLGSFIENGTIHNAPIPHLSPALDLEENTFYSYVEDLGEKLLEGLGVEGPIEDPE